MKVSRVLTFCLIGAMLILLIYVLWPSEKTHRKGMSPEKKIEYSKKEQEVFRKIFSTQSRGGSGIDSSKKKKYRRELTPEEREENRKEFARMRQMIPGNIWIPEGQTEEEKKEINKLNVELLRLDLKMKKGKATPEEKKRFYQIKVRFLGDKIEFVQYVLERIENLKEENDKEYLDEKTVKSTVEVIDEYKKELNYYKEELGKL